MFAFDDDALWSAVRSDYQALSIGVTDAGEINKIFDTIIDNALRTMRMLMRSWNRNSPIETVPPGTLAECLSYLRLRDILRVSHVSQVWRHAALTFPHLWTEIYLPAGIRNRYEIMQLALARSGSLPLDVYYSPADALSLPDEDIEVAFALEPHMHRMRNLDWLSHDQLALCERPASLLEYWGSCRLDIPVSFLGGGGSLRVLELDTMRLPVSCPALETVEELVVYEAAHEGDFLSYYLLFELFPRLQSLQLCNLSAADSQGLPPGAPPQSLRRIALGTLEDRHDLVPHFVEWMFGALRTVEVHMANSAQMANVIPLLDGAVQLAIITGVGMHGADHISTTALMPDGRSHSVGFTDDETRVASVLLSAGDCLAAVHSVAVSLDLLNTFSHIIVTLARVQHLTVYIELGARQPHNVHAAHKCKWQLISCLPFPRVRAAELESVLIDLSCANAACPPNAHDAAQLLAQISAFKVHALLQVHIKGFSRVIAAGIDVSSVPEMIRVSFVD